MVDYGVHEFRIGGVTGRWSGVLPVNVCICPKCRKIEFSATEQTNSILLSRKGFKKCVKRGELIPLASEECPKCGAKQIKSKNKK
jgi:ssDNA-binding Zn-finger/Zn-ribbon topoisomerase 1